MVNEIAQDAVLARRHTVGKGCIRRRWEHHVKNPGPFGLPPVPDYSRTGLSEWPNSAEITLG